MFAAFPAATVAVAALAVELRVAGRIAPINARTNCLPCCLHAVRQRAVQDAAVVALSHLSAAVSDGRARRLAAQQSAHIKDC